MARKLIRRQAGYIAGSVETKEEIATRKKNVQKVKRKMAPKKKTARKTVQKGGAVLREERGKNHREREMGNVLE